MPKKKERQESGDSLAGSSGYGSASESLTQSTSLMRKRQRLFWSWTRLKAAHCKNASRGCLVKTYPRILGLHEQFCKFPEVRKLTVRSKLNFSKAHEEKFNIFCQSFEKSRQVLFLYKKTKELDSVRICVQSYGEENSFTMTFYDKKFSRS